MKEKTHWLDRYANNRHTWRKSTQNGISTFTRPVGLVELSFDTDGTVFGGRADMNALLSLEISHSFSTKEEFRRRVALAWACLGLLHVMLICRTEDNEETKEKMFVVDACGEKSVDERVKEIENRIVWVEDSYPQGVDEEDLYKHCLNVGRIIEPEICLSKLHVLPLKELGDGRFEARFLIILAHQISDGLSAYNWFSHFIRLLNEPEQELKSKMERLGLGEEIEKRLPSAQEDLYTRAGHNKARERWFWAIMRVLRHVRKPLPPTFVNPLRREKRLEIKFPPAYEKIFNYTPSALPPMNSGHINASLSPSASQRLISLCRSIRVSIGAGCFALAGLSMMEIYESRFPDVPDGERLPFTASFPLNPRAFFGSTEAADSCMLAFSEGIVMPFLGKGVSVEGRFKLIARHANRELRMYQKRAKNPGRGAERFDPHDPKRLLATGYLAQLERVEAKLPPQRKTDFNPQGLLQAKTGAFGATCGVSSVGPTASYFRSGVHDLSDVRKNGRDFVANFKDFKQGVRARENEFLVGSSTDAEGIVHFSVSYDLSGISEEAAEGWKIKIEGLLEEGERARL